MKFAHYNKSNILTDSINDLHFRRYLNKQNKRLIDYVEGRLTEIVSEDFDNITYLNDYSLYANDAMYTEGLGTDNYIFEDKPLSINKIELGTNITVIKGDSTSTAMTLLSPIHEGTLEIIFPPNLTDIYGALSGGKNIIWDFSKAKKIPNYQFPSSFSPSQPQTIKVPSSLYSRWKTSTNWSLYESIIIAV